MRRPALSDPMGYSDHCDPKLSVTVLFFCFFLLQPVHRYDNMEAEKKSIRIN